MDLPPDIELPAWLDWDVYEWVYDEGTGDESRELVRSGFFVKEWVYLTRRIPTLFRDDWLDEWKANHSYKGSGWYPLYDRDFEGDYNVVFRSGDITLVSAVVFKLGVHTRLPTIRTTRDISCLLSEHLCNSLPMPLSEYLKPISS